MTFFGQLGAMFDDGWNLLTGGHLYNNGNLTSAEQSALAQTGTAATADYTPATGTTGSTAAGMTGFEELGIFAVVILILVLAIVFWWKKS